MAVLGRVLVRVMFRVLLSQDDVSSVMIHVMVMFSDDMMSVGQLMMVSVRTSFFMFLIDGFLIAHTETYKSC